MGVLVCCCSAAVLLCVSAVFASKVAESANTTLHGMCDSDVRLERHISCLPYLSAPSQVFMVARVMRRSLHSVRTCHCACRQRLCTSTELPARCGVMARASAAKRESFDALWEDLPDVSTSETQPEARQSRQPAVGSGARTQNEHDAHTRNRGGDHTRHGDGAHAQNSNDARTQVGNGAHAQSDNGAPVHNGISSRAHRYNGALEGNGSTQHAHIGNSRRRQNGRHARKHISSNGNGSEGRMQDGSQDCKQSSSNMRMQNGSGGFERRDSVAHAWSGGGGRVQITSDAWLGSGSAVPQGIGSSEHTQNGSSAMWSASNAHAHDDTRAHAQNGSGRRMRTITNGSNGRTGSHRRMSSGKNWRAHKLSDANSVPHVRSGGAERAQHGNGGHAQGQAQNGSARRTRVGSNAGLHFCKNGPVQAGSHAHLQFSSNKRRHVDGANAADSGGAVTEQAGHQGAVHSRPHRRQRPPAKPRQRVRSLHSWMTDVRCNVGRERPPPGVLVSVVANLAHVAKQHVARAQYAQQAQQALHSVLQRALRTPELDCSLFLWTLSKALEAHPALHVAALSSDDFSADVKTAFHEAVAAGHTFKHELCIAQLAVAQWQLGMPCAPFWRALEADGTAVKSARGAANVYHAYGALCAAAAQRKESSLASATLDRKLCTLVARCAKDMTAQEVANCMWAAARMGHLKPRKAKGSLLPVLLAAAERQARQFGPTETAHALWALAVAGALDAGSAQAPLVQAAERNAERMSALEVTNTLWALAAASVAISDDLRDALLQAVRVTAQAFDPQNLANCLWAVAAAKWYVGGDVLDALRPAVHRLAPSMTQRTAATTLWALAEAGIEIDSEQRSALLAAVQRTALRMNTDNVTLSLWAFAAGGFAGSAEAVSKLQKRAYYKVTDLAPEVLLTMLWSLARLQAEQGHRCTQELAQALLHKAAVNESRWSADELLQVCCPSAVMRSPARQHTQSAAMSNHCV